MKIFLLAFLFLTACGAMERRNPAGMLYHVPTYEEVEPLPDDYGEAEIEPTPVATVQAQVFADDDVLRLHMRPPMTLNPLENEDITVSRVLQLLFEPLAIIDENLRITGFLAELEFASDFGSVNATIREGAIWSDGKPISAEDIIFSVETLRRAAPNAIYRANAENIASVIRINSRTVQIVFYNAGVMAGYALNFPVIPAHHSDFFQPISSGPFVFYEYTPMRSLSLRRNPYNSRNRAQIEQVEVLILPDMETDFHAFDRGLVDVLHLPLSDWARHQGVRSPNYDIFPAMYFEFIGFNYTRSIFRDFITRQGIAHSFNAAEAVQSLYLAHAVRSVTPIHPYSWAASTDIHGPTYDPDRAAALLGILRTPAPLEILVNEENSQRVAIAKNLAASLNRAGLPANAAIVPSAEYFSRLSAHDFDLFVGGMKLPFAPDVEFFFQSSPLFMHDAFLEAAFANVQLASTEVAYVQALQNLQQVFADRLPVIGLAFKHSAILTTPRVQGDINPTPCRIFSNVNEWLIY